MYLVDTNVISAAAPTKAHPEKDLVAWMDQHSDLLFLSVITIAEIEAGIARLVDRGSGRKAEQLTAWLDALLHLYGHRVLSVDLAVARELGRMTHAVRQSGRMPEMADLSIVATAKVWGYTVLTRNVRHFEGADVRVIDPFMQLPGPDTGSA